MTNLRSLKLRHLETFVEIARRRSVGRAATSLNLTQPAVTRTLRELEAIAGRPLVERDGRGIRITGAGEVFLRHASRSLAAARGAINAMAELSDADASPVRVGALPTVSASLMPLAVARYLQTGASSRLAIVSGENRVLLEQLRNGDLDLVMGRLPAPELMQGLTFEPFYRDRIAFVVHFDHPLAGNAAISHGELADFPLLLPIRGSIIRPIVDQLFVEQGLSEPPHVIETVSDSFGRTFTARYQAVWIISRGVVSADIDAGKLVELPIDTRSTFGSVGLVTRANARMSPAAEILAEILRRISRGDPE